LDKHADFRFVCRACGKPRLPFDGITFATDPTTLELLRTSYRNGVARLGWLWASIGSFSASFLLGLLATGASFLFDFQARTNLILAVLTAVPLLLAGVFLGARKRASKARSANLELAWQNAARVMRTQRRGQLSASELATALQLDLDQATLLLASAEVDDLLTESTRWRVVDGTDETTEQTDDAVEQAQNREVRR
jgi:hypothetical protein